MSKRSKSKALTRALGLKSEQPKCLQGLAAKGAGAATRYKPGDERLTKNQGAKLQIVAPRLVGKTRKRLLELINEYSDLPIAENLASALGISGVDGSAPSFAEGVAMALHVAAIRGDVNAVKTILQAQQEASSPAVKRGANGLPVPPEGWPPVLNIRFVSTHEEIVEFERARAALAAERVAWEAERRLRETNIEAEASEQA